MSSALDISRYVALGDSLTAGYADGALYYEAQKHSYANILAGQFTTMGGGQFKTPLLDPSSVGINQYNRSRLILKKNGNAPSEVSLAYLALQGDTETLLKNIYTSQGPFNNLGVPGAKIISALMPSYGNPGNGLGNYNPFFARMASNPVSSSILSDALALNPTFFSLFMGNNDALTYALTGCLEDRITPFHGAPGFGFKESLEFILNSLTANGAKGVIANIPDVMSVPFFTAIPYNGLFLTREKALELNRNFSPHGVQLMEGQNPFLVSDPYLESGTIRAMKKGEVILMDLLLDANRTGFLSGQLPIPKKYFLLASEVSSIQHAITEYNRILECASQERQLAFVNINSLLKKTKKDRLYNSQSTNLQYKKGVFSLDGLHPNPLGHVLLANEFIRAINQTYDANVPQASIEHYRDISFSQIENPY
jgi:hypothetical protein